MPIALVIPANPGDRQRLIFVLMGKDFHLADAADALLLRKEDPGVDTGEIDLALGRNELEHGAIRARITELRANDPFKFPSKADLDKLEQALRDLEDAIARTVALNALIRAADGVVKAVPARSTKA